MGLPGMKFRDGWPVVRGADASPRRANRTSTDSRRRLPRWIWLALAAFAILLTPTIVLAVLADHYQPLRYGDTGSADLAYPGLRAPQGARTVNTFGGVREDVYLPPQHGVFFLFAAVMNDGSLAVIIQAVTVPEDGPLKQAGITRYARPPSTGYGTPGIPPARRVVHDLALGPGKEVFFAIPLRSWRCGQRHSWVTEQSFSVRYQFGPFTHVISLPWGSQGDELIMHAPLGMPGQVDTFCVGG